MVEEGASLNEQLIGAARYNNEQLVENWAENHPPADVAKLINSLRDPVGNGLLHLAAQSGSLEVLDVLLDQEGVEIDPHNRLQGNTPLHFAVEYAVGDEALGVSVIELLIEAGANPSPRNNNGKRPIDLAQGNTKIQNVLRGAQYAAELAKEAAAGIGDGAADIGVEDEELDGAEDEEGEEVDEKEKAPNAASKS